MNPNEVTALQLHVNVSCVSERVFRSTYINTKTTLEKVQSIILKGLKYDPTIKIGVFYSKWGIYLQRDQSLEFYFVNKRKKQKTVLLEVKEYQDPTIAVTGSQENHEFQILVWPYTTTNGIIKLLNGGKYSLWTDFNENNDLHVDNEIRVEDDKNFERYLRFTTKKDRNNLPMEIKDCYVKTQPELPVTTHKQNQNHRKINSIPESPNFHLTKKKHKSMPTRVSQDEPKEAPPKRSSVRVPSSRKIPSSISSPILPVEIERPFLPPPIQLKLKEQVLHSNEQSNSGRGIEKCVSHFHKKKHLHPDKAVSSILNPGETWKLHYENNYLITCTTKKGNPMIYAGSCEYIIVHLVDSLQVKFIKIQEFQNTTLPWNLSNPVWIDLMESFILSYQRFFTCTYLLGVIFGLWEQTKNFMQQSPEKQSFRLNGIAFFILKWLDLQYADFQGTHLIRLKQWIHTMPLNVGTVLLNLLSTLSLPIPTPTQLLTYVDSEDQEESRKLLEHTEDCLRCRLKHTQEEYILKEKGGYCRSHFRVVSGWKNGHHHFLGWSVLDINSDNFADQWTILDMKIFREITCEEMLQPIRPNWKRIIERGKKLSTWVASQILQAGEVDYRTLVVAQFISIALRFLDLNNFNGLMSVLEGLGIPSVSRLRHTREALLIVEPKAHEAWMQFEEILCSDAKFIKLKESIQTQLIHHEAVVPWLKLIEKEIDELEVFSDYVFHEEMLLLNFEKIIVLANYKKHLINCQKSIKTVNIDEENQNNQITQSLLENLIVLPEDKMMAFSLEIEKEE